MSTRGAARHVEGARLAHEDGVALRDGGRHLRQVVGAERHVRDLVVLFEHLAEALAIHGHKRREAVRAHVQRRRLLRHRLRRRGARGARLHSGGGDEGGGEQRAPAWGGGAHPCGAVRRRARQCRRVRGDVGLHAPDKGGHLADLRLQCVCEVPALALQAAHEGRVADARRVAAAQKRRAEAVLIVAVPCGGGDGRGGQGGVFGVGAARQAREVERERGAVAVSGKGGGLEAVAGRQVEGGVLAAGGAGAEVDAVPRRGV